MCYHVEFSMFVSSKWCAIYLNIVCDVDARKYANHRTIMVTCIDCTTLLKICIQKWNSRQKMLYGMPDIDKTQYHVSETVAVGIILLT